MATESFLRDVDIKEKNLVHTLVGALEKADARKPSPDKTVMSCKEVTGNDIKILLGKK